MSKIRDEADKRARYHDRALGKIEQMPRYDIQCDMCSEVHEIRLSFEQKDSLTTRHGFVTDCPRCGNLQRHVFVITQVPGVEWKTDGAYTYDNADPTIKYQREHFADSGDIGEKRLRDRKKRRGHA